MEKDNERKEDIQRVRTGIRPALPVKLQIEVKDEIRKLFATHSKGGIVEVLVEKFDIQKRTAYNYIGKTVKEDLKDINKENLVMEIIHNRHFRKLQLLTLYHNEFKKEKDSIEVMRLEVLKPKREQDRSKLRPYVSSPVVKAHILTKLADEDKLIVDLLQQTSIIRKPVERQEIEQKNYTFSIELKHLGRVIPKMIKDGTKHKDSMDTYTQTMGSLSDSTGQNHN